MSEKMTFHLPDVKTSADQDSLPVVLVVVPVAIGAVILVAALVWSHVSTLGATRRPLAHQSQPQNVRRSQLAERLNRDEIGSRFNHWRKPEAYFGPEEADMKSQLCSTLGMEDFDIRPDEWGKATDIADRVIRMMLSEICKEARVYKLIIEKFVRQGSAREGLKVSIADEFDVLVQFSVEDLRFEVEEEKNIKGRTLPEIGKLIAIQTGDCLEANYSKLWSAGAFCVQNGNTYLNSRRLHEKVFTAVIDKARETVTKLLDASEHCTFSIRRAINQPAVKITVDFNYQGREFDARDHVTSAYNSYTRNHQQWTVNEAAAKIPTGRYSLDVDLVPSLLICHDKVPDPSQFGTLMDCPRYAVFKWVRDDHPFAASGVNPETIWRMDTSGYEKHVLDVARGIREQRYILTAQRVLKAYFLFEKNKSDNPPQVVTVLRSYFLKQLAFYCILYFTVINRVQLSGVKEALTILIDLLEICLQEQSLPHFFHTNPWLVYMFPDYDVGTNALRYDLFHTISADALRQARLDIRRHVRPTLEKFTCDLQQYVKEIEDKFRDFIVEGDYMFI